MTLRSALPTSMSRLNTVALTTSAGNWGNSVQCTGREGQEIMGHSQTDSPAPPSFPTATNKTERQTEEGQTHLILQEGRVHVQCFQDRFGTRKGPRTVPDIRVLGDGDPHPAMQSPWLSTDREGRGRDGGGESQKERNSTW